MASAGPCAEATAFYLIAGTYWYDDCIVLSMLATLTIPDLTWLFLAVVVSLGVVAVWALWEVEQRSQRHRKSDRFG